MRVDHKCSRDPKSLKPFVCLGVKLLDNDCTFYELISAHTKHTFSSQDALLREVGESAASEH
ncbi:unnamed protein product [Leuciscus chuanchicus]